MAAPPPNQNNSNTAWKALVSDYHLEILPTSIRAEPLGRQSGERAQGWSPVSFFSSSSSNLSASKKERKKRYLPCVTKYVAAFRAPDKCTHLHHFWKALSCGALFTRCWVSLKLSKWFQGSVKQCVPRVQKESWFDTHNCHTKPTVNSHDRVPESSSLSSSINVAHPLAQLSVATFVLPSAI